jgi:hypothetical protein
MNEAIIFNNESDFRLWFEKNLGIAGVKRIILSQEVCPDYVVEMENGEIAKIEAELFAINFKYHNHDPAKVDYILACYSREEEVIGVPVISMNKLWKYEPNQSDPLPPEGPLPAEEFEILGIISFHGSIELSQLSVNKFAGSQSIFLFFSPEYIVSAPKGKFPRGRIEDNLFNAISPETKKYIKKYQHIMVGSNLSDIACESLENLMRRKLVELKPISFLSALYDGTLIQHDGWLPTEVRLTELAKDLYLKDLRKWHVEQLHVRDK